MDDEKKLSPEMMQQDGSDLSDEALNDIAAGVKLTKSCKHNYVRKSNNMWVCEYCGKVSLRS